MMTVGLTARLTLTNMRGKWMKMDKTSGMMAAGDICEFSNCSLFHHIKLPSPNLQTRRNRPSASAEWAAVSKGSIGCMLQERFLLPKQHLSERMSPPKRTNRPLRLRRPHFQPSHPFHSFTLEWEEEEE